MQRNQHGTLTSKDGESILVGTTVSVGKTAFDFLIDGMKVVNAFDPGEWDWVPDLPEIEPGSPLEAAILALRNDWAAPVEWKSSSTDGRYLNGYIDLAASIAIRQLGNLTVTEARELVVKLVNKDRPTT